MKTPTKLPKPKTLPLTHRRKSKAVASTSSHVAGHSYVTSTGQLDVTFKNGRSYRYENVPVARAAAFANADSKGTFLHAHILPHHKGTRLPDDPEPELKKYGFPLRWPLDSPRLMPVW